METPSFKEDHISQIPALQFLQNLGYANLIIKVKIPDLAVSLGKKQIIVNEQQERWV